MKTTLIALALGAVTGLCSAAGGAPYSPEIMALRYECAAKYYPTEYASRYYSPQAYEKGEYKGKSECTDQQYSSYLETVDPTRVMSAYPTAAGKPGYKNKAYKPDYNSKDYDRHYDKDYDKDYDKGYDKSEEKK
ncbi:MAG: hypothetical protein JO006_18885 [Paucibacter sp.]|nr:hypothetical protein [Roseateles sp.]